MRSSNEGGDKKVIQFRPRQTGNQSSPQNTLDHNGDASVSPISAMRRRNPSDYRIDENQMRANAAKVARQRELETATATYKFSTFLTQRPGLYNDFQRVFAHPTKRFSILNAGTIPDFSELYPSIKASHISELSKFLIDNSSSVSAYAQELEDWLKFKFPDNQDIRLVCNADENSVEISG